LTHGVAHTVTVNEDVLGHCTIKISVALERSLEVIRKHTRRNNLLPLLWLRSSLCIVLAEVGVIRGAETDGTLFALMADINSDEHGGLRYFLSKAHAPEITSNLSVHLTNYVHKNAIVILGDRAVSYKLRDDRGLTVDLVLEERIEVLVVRVVGHDDQEDKAGFGSSRDVRLHATVVVELDALCKSL